MNTRQIILAIIGITGYVAYGLIAYFIDRSQMSGFLALNVTMVTGTLGLCLRDLPSAPDVAPPRSARSLVPMAPGERQAGFAAPCFLLCLFVAAALVMSGCGSLQYAGSAEYSVKPFVVDAQAGTVACCEVMIRNGKEIAHLEAHVSKQGDNYTVDLKEQGVMAFKGQEITATMVRTMIDDAVKAAAAAALGPVVPALGAALK